MFEQIRVNHDNYIANYLNTGKAQVIGIGRKVQVRKKDGSAVDCKLFVTKKSDDNKMFFTGLLQID